MYQFFFFFLRVLLIWIQNIPYFPPFSWDPIGSVWLISEQSKGCSSSWLFRVALFVSTSVYKPQSYEVFLFDNSLEDSTDLIEWRHASHAYGRLGAQ